MNPTIKGAIKSKAVWLGAVTLLLGFWQTALPGVLPEKWMGLANLIIGSLVIIIRFYTDRSLEEKGE